MDSKRQLTVDIIAKVATGKMDIIHAATLLGQFREIGRCSVGFWGCYSAMTIA